MILIIGDLNSIGKIVLRVRSKLLKKISKLCLFCLLFEPGEKLNLFFSQYCFIISLSNIEK